MKPGDEKLFLAKIKQAIHRYGLLDYGDRIAVAVSGGKDSLFLLHTLDWLCKQSFREVQLFPIRVDLGWREDTTLLKKFCHSKQLELTEIKTHIGTIVHDVRQENNPCSLCSHMRRGALNNAALDLNCNKVALGHHLDDVLATLLINFFYTGRLATFRPRTSLSRSGLELIRPLVYIPESTIIEVVKRDRLPVCASCCPSVGVSKRAEMELLMGKLSQRFPDWRQRFLNAWESNIPPVTWGYAR
ncbi:MAG: tRNA 2-thiocytidine biosynthesis protein TtcA [Firmicutes bacterium]|nr:tRNA 2-thiocytidine biosynthesis protein TtcA [Bacillota bacterium]